MATRFQDTACGGDVPPTVLIVEDEAAVREALLDFLALNGFNTLEAANAAEALRTIEEAGAAIDLVFTDVRMPGAMDGLALAQWVHHELPRIPVIVASGFGDNASAAKAAGEQVMQKPYRMEDVIAHIRATIAAQRTTPDA